MLSSCSHWQSGLPNSTVPFPSAIKIASILHGIINYGDLHVILFYLFRDLFSSFTLACGKIILYILMGINFLSLPVSILYLHESCFFIAFYKFCNYYWSHTVEAEDVWSCHIEFLCCHLWYSSSWCVWLDVLYLSLLLNSYCHWLEAYLSNVYCQSIWNCYMFLFMLCTLFLGVFYIFFICKVSLLCLVISFLV